MEHQVCHSLSFMARLPFRQSLALWLTAKEAWIMSASVATDGPSCAGGLFISRTYLNTPLSDFCRTTGMRWVCERERKARVRNFICKRKQNKQNKLRGVMIWAAFKQLQAKLTGCRSLKLVRDLTKIEKNMQLCSIIDLKDAWIHWVRPTPSVQTIRGHRQLLLNRRVYHCC